MSYRLSPRKFYLIWRMLLILGLILGSVQPVLASAVVRSQEKVGEVWEISGRVGARQSDEVSDEFAHRSVEALNKDVWMDRDEAGTAPAKGAETQDGPLGNPNPPFDIPMPPPEPPLRSMAALSLQVDAPETVAVGEKVIVKVTAINVGAEKVSGAVVRLDVENGRGFADDKSYPCPTWMWMNA